MSVRCYPKLLLVVVVFLCSCSSGVDATSSQEDVTPLPVTEPSGRGGTSEDSVAVEATQAEYIPTETPEPPGVVLSETPNAVELTDDRPTDTPLSELEEFLGIVDAPEKLAELQAEAYQKQAEYLTSCVREAGFDRYQAPDIDVPVYQTPNIGGEIVALKENGYGLASTLLDRIERYVLAVEEGNDPAAPPPELAEPLTSDSERRALAAAEGACWNEAGERHPGPGESDGGLSEDTLLEIADVMSGMYSDPGFDELTAEWAACMRSEGLDAIGSRNDLLAPLQRQMFAAEEELMALQRDYVPGGVNDQVPESLFDAQVALRAAEMAVVDLDIKCLKATNFDQKRSDLTARLQAEILEVHGERWSLLLAEAGQ